LVTNQWQGLSNSNHFIGRINTVSRVPSPPSLCAGTRRLRFSPGVTEIVPVPLFSSFLLSPSLPSSSSFLTLHLWSPFPILRRSLFVYKSGWSRVRRLAFINPSNQSFAFLSLCLSLPCSLKENRWVSHPRGG